MTDAPDTVTAALKLLADRGYTESLTVGDGAVKCSGCTNPQPLDNVVVDEVFRFEGQSNPDDEAIVLGVRCTECDTKGTIVSAYGPGADPEVLDSLVLLEAKFRRDGV